MQYYVVLCLVELQLPPEIAQNVSNSTCHGSNETVQQVGQCFGNIGYQ